MQPWVTVVLATVWLAVYVDVVGTATLHPSRLTLDQYSPLAPHRHGVYRKFEDQLDWKDQNPAVNQPLDLSIGPRRSISSSNTESPKQSFGMKYLEKDLIFSRTGNSAADDFSPLFEDKQFHNFDGREFTDEKVDGKSPKTPELLSRELPPSELEDPFVADDTFQDQGPGSVEIYKLDLLREKPLLSPTPMTKLLTQSKSKTPKKSGHVSWKAKTTEYGVTSPKMFYKQSNSFDDSSTEMPPNSDPFSIGGVPELQVGCEGLEASNHKQKRSIDSPTKGKELGAASDLWVDATPISLDVDYDLPSEDGYEEMDELLKLKISETTTKRVKLNRGDMEATLHSDFFDDKRRAEKLPVRGDLGKFSVANETTTTLSALGNQRTERRGSLAETGNKESRFAKVKRSVHDGGRAKSVDSLTANQGRKILWLDDSGTGEQLEDGNRSKRAVWGFGEDEGVVSSDELQTENQRRRKNYERRRQEEERKRQEAERTRKEEAQRRSYIKNQTNVDIERIRNDYDKLLEQRQNEQEERQRQLHQNRSTTNRWQLEEEHRRRIQEEETRRNRWEDEKRRQQELESSRRRHEPRPQTSPEEEERKRQRSMEEHLRRREEMRRKEQWEEAAKRRQQELDRRNMEERRIQQQNGSEPPTNLLYAMRSKSNESRSYETETDRRMREQREREHDQKLREYIQRNRPIKVDTPADQRKEEANRRRLEEDRKRQEEERKLQEYIRRNQPIRVEKNWSEPRRTINVAGLYNRSRYPGPSSGRRNHGPSAPTNVYPQSYVDDVRRTDAIRRFEEGRIREREKQREEQLRREALRREEESRRIQTRRYEEQRKRQEAAALEADRRLKEMMEAEARRNQAARTRPLENTRPVYEDRRRFEEHRRRQDAGLTPANLRLNESRRGMELERQRQEQERRRLEVERQRQEESRAKEARENEERARAMKEQRRRQEEARLNALPVSARIIIRHGASSSIPNVFSRINTDNDIDFTGINPNRHGVQIPKFPATATRRPSVKSPPPCVWAVVQCCPSNVNRLVTCFEAMGCPGINWDPNPCRGAITQAATDQVMKFYAEIEEDERY
ncbi:uncharacterized protein LOC143148980 isoform X2 [Ptiloglossa arizonensis]